MTKELTNKVSEDTLALLRDSYPVEQSNNRIKLPRLSMASQDKTEGKGKSLKVVTEAGTFFIEKETDEVNEEGKKIWEKTELGNGISGIILYKRKQLRMYDEDTETYTSSPVFDDVNETVPLFSNKQEVARGTVAELKALYQYTDKDGKQKSRLEDNVILYVEYEGDVYQMNLRGSSMYSFLGYSRKVIVPSVVTKFSSEAKEKGTIAWNQMTFEPEQSLTEAQAQEVVAKIAEIKEAIEAERGGFTRETTEVERVSEEEAKKF